MRFSSILRLAAAARDEGQDGEQQGTDQDDVERKERRISPARHAQNKQERRHAPNRPSRAAAVARRAPIEERNEHQQQAGRAEEENRNRFILDPEDLAARNHLERLEHEDEVPLRTDVLVGRSKEVRLLAELPREKSRQRGQDSEREDPA